MGGFSSDIFNSSAQNYNAAVLPLMHST
jgi:hypothetical protein